MTRCASSELELPTAAGMKRAAKAGRFADFAKDGDPMAKRYARDWGVVNFHRMVAGTKFLNVLCIRR